MFMKVYAFIGQSGTGKSYKAFMVAKDRDIDYIIDDGLLIGGTRIIAGKSAKKENTRIAAVKRALFSDMEHRLSVKEAIEEIQPDKLLVLGTSHKMISQIREALDLPKESEVIYIEQVSSKHEIELAQKSRKSDGKHVIPAPTVEVKKSFSGYFMDSLKIFRKKDKAIIETEKTIIRPTFSYLGKYEISNSALTQMISYCVQQLEGVCRVLEIKIDNEPSGIIINITLCIELKDIIKIMLYEIQKKVVIDIERMTGLNIISVNVLASKIEFSSGSLVI